MAASCVRIVGGDAATGPLGGVAARERMARMAGSEQGEMTFQSPGRLGFLLLVPLVIAGYVAARRRRAQRTAALTAQGLAVAEVGRRLGWRRHLPFALIALALAGLAVGLARPAATVKTPRRQGTVVLAIDVSNSMGATDVTPSRLEAAKAAARAFVAKQPTGVRMAVVAFGDGAVPVQIFTT